MKKVVASLVLASLISSSASAVDVIGAVRSTSANIVKCITKNPKAVSLSAASVCMGLVALTAYKYPEGRTRSFVKKFDPRGLFASTEVLADTAGNLPEASADETPVAE